MNTSQKYLLVVGGPTASGKTGLAIALAQHFDTVVLSADSRQFYQEMRIGNARPSAEELASVPHHFIADRSVADGLNAGGFAREALTLLSEIFQTKDHAVVVGGSGLFLKALTEGLDRFPDIPAAIRQSVDELYEAEGLAGLQAALETADPSYYATAEQQNPARLRRALEVCRVGEEPYSYYLRRAATQRPFTPIYFQPTWLREQLYARINLRVDQMVAAGLEAEARQLHPQRALPALQTVGYQEWFAHFTGEIDRPRAIELIKQNSRRYAKRQLTWNRRDGYWKAIPQADLRSALAYYQLVTQEGLRLNKYTTKAESKPLFSTKEKYQTTTLIKGQEEPEAYLTSIILADWACVLPTNIGSLSHLAQVILWHEVLHRSEAATVYTQASIVGSVELLVELGFQQVSLEDLPLKLQAQIASGDPKYWRWERGEQSF